MEGFRDLLGFDTIKSEDDSRFPNDYNSTADFVSEGLPQCSRTEAETESNGFSQLISVRKHLNLIKSQDHPQCFNS